MENIIHNKLVKISIQLDDLPLPEESLKVLATLDQIPVMMVSLKCAIVDEMFFFVNKSSKAEQIAIYQYATALNTYLNEFK